MRLRMNAKREARLRRAMQAMGEKTKSKAIDRALAHYLADLENKQRIAEELSSEHVEALHTSYLPLQRETTVGPKDEP